MHFKGARGLVFLAFVLLTIAPALPAEIDKQKTDAFLKMDFWEFDQKPNGWRSLRNSDGTLDYNATAKLLDTYYEQKKGVPESQRTLLAFHAGQNYGFAKQTEEAISRFRKSFQNDQPDWNAYVEATIAFLKNDKDALLKAREKLAVMPGQMNLNVIDRLVRNFGRSYFEAYSDMAITDRDVLGHVAANVPEDSEFNKTLTNDLNSYFNTVADKTVNVEFELLRKVATQSGVAYPKFYAWIRVYKSGKLFQQGAARLAAIDQTGFEVTNFLNAEMILSEPTKIESIFPAALCSRIMELARAKP